MKRSRRRPSVSATARGPAAVDGRPGVLASPWLLASALLVGAGLRIAYLVGFRRVPLFDHLQLDHRVYDEWGRRIAAGDWLGSKVFFVDPLYAYFLGGLYALFGHDLLLVRIVHLLLGMAVCVGTALLGRRVFGSAALGNVACLFTALFVPALLYESAVDKTVLAELLFSGAFLAFLGTSRRAALGAGLALGLAILTRGNFLALVPFAALALALEPREDAGTRPWRHSAAAMRTALLVAGTFAVVATATVRNCIVARELVLTTSNLGMNLYIGHLPGSLGTYYPPPFARADPEYEEEDFAAEAARRAGRPLDARATSAFWTRAALAEIAAAPREEATRTLHKLWLFWNDYEVPDNDDMEFAALVYAPVLRLPVVRMGLLFPLALLGAVVWWRENRAVRLVAGAVVLYCASVVAFFVLSRLRAPIVPLLAVLAAGGASWLWDAVRTRNPRRVALGAATLAVGAAVSLTRPVWVEQQRQPTLAISYHNLGQLYRQLGQQDAAADALERALATPSVMQLATIRSLADLRLERREYAEAERLMLQALQLEPAPAERAALVTLYETMLADDRHRADPAIVRKLANAYRAAGRGADAERLTASSAP